MTKGSDRRARGLLTGTSGYYLLPIRPPRSSPRAQSFRARTIPLFYLVSEPTLSVLVSSRLISLCRFFRVPLFVTAALSLSIIFCFFFFFFFLLRYGLRRFIIRNRHACEGCQLKLLESLLNPHIYII